MSLSCLSSPSIAIIKSKLPTPADCAFLPMCALKIPPFETDCKTFLKFCKNIFPICNYFEFWWLLFLYHTGFCAALQWLSVISKKSLRLQSVLTALFPLCLPCIFLYKEILYNTSFRSKKASVNCASCINL